MLIIRFFIGILFIIITGYFIFYLLIRNKKNFSIFEIFALSFGLGSGLISLWMFLISLLKLKFSLFFLLLPTFIFLILSFKSIKNEYKNFYLTKINFSITFLGIVLISLICFNIFYVLLKAAVFPFIQWDAWCNWGFKARLFFSEGFVSGGLFREYASNIPRPDQPLNLYLMLTYIYQFLGVASEEYSRLYLALFYVSLLIIQYYALRRHAGKMISLIITFFISSIPNVINLASEAYGDIAFAFYCLSAIIYLYLYETKKSNDFLLLGSIFLGMSLWTKSEGLLLWFNILLCFLLYFLFKSIYKKKIIFDKNLAIGLALSFVYILPWKIFMKINKFIPQQHLIESYFNQSFSELFNRLKNLLILVVNDLININRWNIFWIIFILAIIYSFKTRRFYFFLNIFLLQFLFYVFIFLIWPRDAMTLASVFYNTFPRLLLQIAPIAAIFIGWQLEEFYVRRQNLNQGS